GFASEPERSLFRQLIKVSGVGAKMAITILSGASVDEFARAIRDSDTARLVRLPGIGKKTAERLVVEMRDKLSVHSSDATPLSFVHDGPSAQPTDAVSDAVSALVALGYKPQEASRWMGSINAEGLSSEELIRQALRLAAK
ncbi:MAG: holliday junction DNA helicase RuvA, partial [Halothiobacillaceae bacterium]